MVKEIKNITILGAGAFGFALAKVMGDEIDRSININLYDINTEIIDSIKKSREHPYFHKGIFLNERINITSSSHESIDSSDLVVLAVPSKFLRIAVEGISDKVKDGVVFLSLAKGFEDKTNLRMSEVVSEAMCLSKNKYHYACLSGGMIADEVAIKRPLAMDIACRDIKIAEQIREVLNFPCFKINVSSDVVGIELAGSLKNIVAIGAGFFDGIDCDYSSKAAFVSVAAKRIKDLAIKLGANPDSYKFGSQAFLGDLITTCFGNTRNREYGELIGSGKSPKEAFDIMKKNKRTVEGVHTIEVVVEKMKSVNYECKLISGIYKVLNEEKTVGEFLTKFIDDL